MPRLNRALALAAVAFLAASGTSSARAAETIKLDSHNAANDLLSDGTPAQSAPLAAGAGYVITVTGTATIWGTAQGVPTCGVAEASPIEPSPGEASRAGTWDAATVFAAPTSAGIAPLGIACSTVSLPRSTLGLKTGFQIANGGAYFSPTPYGGTREAPRSDHSYSYQLSGTGNPVRFRFADTPVADNSGVFTIVIQTDAECAASNCLKTQVPTADQSATPVVPAATGSVAVLGTRTCSTDTVLSVRLIQPRGTTFSKTSFYINSKYQRTVSGKKLFIGKTKHTLRAQKFRNLPSGTLALKILVTTTKGQRTVIERSITRCDPRVHARRITFD